MAHSEKYTGVLGFETLGNDLLDRSSAVVVETFEEYGHLITHFGARASNRIHMECDQFRIELRRRRVPSIAQDGSATPAGARLEVVLLPAFPEYCDDELAELHLAVLLQRLVQQLEADTVKWLDTPKVLTRAEFLGVFASGGPENTDAAADADGAISVTGAGSGRKQQLAAETRPRASDRFAPVEETASELERQCEVILQEARDRASGRYTAHASERARSRMHAALRRTRGSLPQRISGWVANALHVSDHHISPPAPAGRGGGLISARNLRFSAQVLTVAALFLMVKSTGMVRAAISYIP